MVNETDEKALVDSILAGQLDNFQILIEKYQRLVAHIVFKMIPSETDREDLCQDVFLRVYHKLGSFSYKSKLSTWIGQIAYNRCLSVLEKKKAVLFDDITEDEFSLDQLEAETQLPDSYTEQNELATLLSKEMDKLPPQYKTIITLYHMEEMSYNEISDITGLPEGTVKSHLFRGRKMLKDRLMSRYRKEDLCH